MRLRMKIEIECHSKCNKLIGWNSVLRCVAVCCSVLRRMRSVTVRCRVLQCVAVCCSVLQCVAANAECCSVLQCVAVCRSVLQCVAVCCSECRALQSVAEIEWNSNCKKLYSRLHLECHLSSFFSLNPIGLFSYIYSLLHLECHSISFSKLNPICLFSTERGKSDVENLTWGGYNS